MRPAGALPLLPFVPPRPGPRPVLPSFLPDARGVPSRPACLPVCPSVCLRASPSPRHSRPRLLSLPWGPGPPPLPSCPGAGPALSPPSCRHAAPSPGLDLQPEAPGRLLFRPFESHTLLTAPAWCFSSDKPLSVALAWFSGPRWACFPLPIRSTFAPVPNGLARWMVEAGCVGNTVLL